MKENKLSRSLSLSPWSGLIYYDIIYLSQDSNLNNSLSLSLSDWLAGWALPGRMNSLSLSLIGWPKAKISVLHFLLFLYFAFPFCFVFLNCAAVLILSVCVVLVSKHTVLVRY